MWIVCFFILDFWYVLVVGFEKLKKKKYFKYCKKVWECDKGMNLSVMVYGLIVKMFMFYRYFSKCFLDCFYLKVKKNVIEFFY